MTRIAVTGANSAAGRALVRAVAGAEAGGLELVALVRSERAAREVPPLPQGRGRRVRAPYDEPATLVAALAGVASLIHLPGVLVERPGSTYEQANVETTRVAVEAAREAGVRKLVLVSAHGADPQARNRYFATKGEAERLVRESGLAWTILRAPLLLGPATQQAEVLQRALARGRAWLVGGGHARQEPLDVDDLARAALRAAAEPALVAGCTLDLGGPESLSTRAIFERAAALAGRPLRLRSVPATPLRWLLALRTRLAGPGPSPDFLEVLLEDTRADGPAAARALGIEWTPLEATIRSSLRAPEETP